MNEQPEKEWWLQSDPQKEGWGPFKSEGAAWRYLFGHDPTEYELKKHIEAGWNVGFINRWPNVI